MNRAAALACAFALLAAMATAAASRKQESAATFFADRDERLVAEQLATLPRQQPGVVDLYAIGVAGDGSQDVFRNEADYFAILMSQRFHARGVLTLVSHPDSLGTRPKPLATHDNLHDAVRGVAKRMNRREDILLLYLTMHGTPEHELALFFPPLVNDLLTPDDLAHVLDRAGIRNRVIVMSACYSGGFIRRLRGDGTLLMTAARSDRPSFGCGDDSTATFFGRAWLAEGLNRSTDFVEAFRHAEGRIQHWERAKEYEASHPQLSQGARIKAKLADWQADLQAGAPVAYPWPLDEADEADGATKTAPP